MAVANQYDDFLKKRGFSMKIEGPRALWHARLFPIVPVTGNHDEPRAAAGTLANGLAGFRGPSMPGSQTVQENDLEMAGGSAIQGFLSGNPQASTW